jgi:hypothetical protein
MNMTDVESSSHTDLHGGLSKPEIRSLRDSNKLTDGFPQEDPVQLIKRLSHDHAADFLNFSHFKDPKLAARIVGGLTFTLDENHPSGGDQLNLTFDRRVILSQALDGSKPISGEQFPYGGIFYASSRTAEQLSHSLLWSEKGEDNTKFPDLVIPHGVDALRFIQDRFKTFFTIDTETYLWNMTGTREFTRRVQVEKEDGSKEPLIIRVLWEPPFDAREEGYSLEQWRARTKAAVGSLAS